MAKFPYGGFGGQEHEDDPPWLKLKTIQEYLEDGEVLPPVLAQWLGEAIKRANEDPGIFLVELGLRKPRGAPSAWSKPKAKQALWWLYQLVTAGCINDPDAPEELRCRVEGKSKPAFSDSQAIDEILKLFMMENGNDDRFSRPTLQRWLNAVREAETEARIMLEEWIEKSEKSESALSK